MNWTDLNFFKGADKIVADRLAKDMNAGVAVVPPVHQIMRAFDLTKFDKVKAVILGQDPYPTSGHANGLAFSVDPCVVPIPKSLQNIFTELESDIGEKRSAGCLSDWASQGVLLLNTVLTCETGQAGSHQGIGWEALSDEAIKTLSDKRENIVFILWGKKAQAKIPLIDKSKHLIIKSSHPSPLSSYRGFFGSKPFSKTNEYLREHGKQEIRWK